MSNQDKIQDIDDHEDNILSKSQETLDNSMKHGSKLKQQVLLEEEQELSDSVPEAISNTGNKPKNKKNLRKRSSTESAILFETSKLLNRTRRYSKPLLETVIKNSDKQNRLSKVNEKRHSRLSQHILKYLQLNIEIKGNNSNSFMITIEKQKTVEELIYQIEAEYAFQFISPKEKTPFGSKKDYSEPILANPQQFECNAVMNSDGEVLKYSDIVGEVFDMFDSVICTNVYEESVPPRDNYELYNTINDLDNEEYLNNENAKKGNTEYNSSVKSKGEMVKKHRQDHDKIYSMIPNPTLDERFQSILHNKITLNMFYTFCLKEYSVENLLFWLDVEIFQTVNKDNYELYSNYIYYTYIDSKAPLQINITEEIKSDIKINEANYSDPSILEIFDEAQEHIYIMLKICLYQKFEANKIFKKLQDYKANNRKEYEKNRILGFYGNYYRPDYELIRQKLEDLNNNKRDSFINFNNVQTNAYQLLYQSNWLTSAISQCVILNNNDELKNYMKTSERRIKEVKNMKLQKGKKLAKFFGEIVDVETLCKQVKKISKQEDFKNDSTTDLVTLQQPEREEVNEKKSVQNIKNEFDQEERKRLVRKNEKLNAVLGETLTEDQVKDIVNVDKRKKRMKYLQHFLYNQIDDKEIANEIKIEQEKAMADITYERRRNKLNKLFGQAPPPDLINKNTQIENKHRRSIISLTLLLSKEDGVVNLFNMVNNIEKEEAINKNKNRNSNKDETKSIRSVKSTRSTKSDKRSVSVVQPLNPSRDATETAVNEINNKIGDNDKGTENEKSENITIVQEYSPNIESNEENEENEDDSDDSFEISSRRHSYNTQSSIKDQNEIICEYYETKNMEYLVEKNVFSTLEESINEDITDPETKEGFKKQLGYLRENFIKNSNNIRRMSQMNTSLLRDSTENIWNGSNLLKPMIDNEVIVNRDYTDNSNKPCSSDSPS